MPEPTPSKSTAAQPEKGFSERSEDLIGSVTAATTHGQSGAFRDSVELAVYFAAKTGRAKERIDSQAIDAMIAELDRAISSQVDEVLHNEKFQALESAWRGLKFVVDRSNLGENIELHMIQATAEELRQDFTESSGDVVKSGLYKKVHRAEFGQFGGLPYGLILGNYAFSSTARDVELLSNIAAVSAMAHAPFIAAANPELLGLKDFEALSNLNDVKANIKSADVATKWKSFRQSEDSRYVGLTLPRFLLRLPYDPKENPTQRFGYTESVKGGPNSYLWGNTAFAFATRVTDSFAKYRWYQHIVGPQAGGTVENLPIHVFESSGRQQTKIPTEVLIPEVLDVSLSSEGFIPLVMRKGSDEAAFFAASSCQAPKNFGQSAEGKEAETNYKLGTQLPYIFIISRLAHYLKVQQREQIGGTLTRQDLEKRLDKWLRQYVTAQDVVDELTKAKRPLREAEVKVFDIPGEPGWYKITLKVRPHIQYLGAFFELSLVGKMSNKKGE